MACSFAATDRDGAPPSQLRMRTLCSRPMLSTTTPNALPFAFLSAAVRDRTPGGIVNDGVELGNTRPVAR